MRGALTLVAEPAIGLSRADERRRALAAIPAAREVLEFVASPACWDAMRRLYG